jgi:adenosylhomocysteine nucleosidase
MSRSTILISANAEWRAIRRLFPKAVPLSSPFGEYFITRMGDWQSTFMHGGWGKISAAASTQFAIDHLKPDLLVNLGTCGGFAGEIERGAVVLVEKTIVYDILEQMGDFDAHIAHYTTPIDLSWLGEPYPMPVVRTLLVSGDRDLLAEEVSHLKERYLAIAGDWESGAIAWVAARNDARLLILRGVTDLVGAAGSAAYGDLDYFEESAFEVMRELVKSLPGWLEIASIP